MSTEAEMQRLVQAKLDEIGEHADCVIILATWREGGETMFISETCGNGFAHDALLKHYMDAQEPTEEEFRDEWEKEE